MSTLPLISIIIPSYNSADYIEETLLSLAKQTAPNYEVILVDDGSTDSSLAVAEQCFKKFNLKGLYIARPNSVTKGVASCRNYGIKMSSGDWMAFLDSDDLYEPQAIENTTKNILLHGATCSAYLHANCEFDDETGAVTRVKVHNHPSELLDYLPILLTENHITTSAVTLKKSLIEDIGFFDTSLHGIEDYMMWLRASKRTKWCYSPEVLTKYRVRQLSLMGGRKLMYYIEQNKLLIEGMQLVKEFNTDEIAKVDHYLDETLNYYAQISINKYGWDDFKSGIKLLKQNGKIAVAEKLYKFHHKNHLLKKVYSILRPKK